MLERLAPPTVGIVLQRVVDRPGLREIVASPVEALRTILGDGHTNAPSPRPVERPFASASTHAPGTSSRDVHDPREAPAAHDTRHDDLAARDARPGFETDDVDQAFGAERPSSAPQDDDPDVDDEQDADRRDIVLLDDGDAAPHAPEPGPPEPSTERPPGVPREAWWRRDST